MKYATALLAAAAGVSASAYGYGNNGTVVYTTEVLPVYTTYCPSPTEVTYGGKTYTVTKPTTLTISDCTVTRPVYTTTEVACHTCEGKPPVYQTPVVKPPPGTAGVTPTKPAPTTVHTGAADKAVALSGAGLAGLLAAFIL